VPTIGVETYAGGGLSDAGESTDVGTLPAVFTGVALALTGGRAASFAPAVAVAFVTATGATNAAMFTALRPSGNGVNTRRAVSEKSELLGIRPTRAVSTTVRRILRVTY
jgi:hypothetical protein